MWEKIIEKVIDCLDRFLCDIGCHYWNYPGGWCRSCGKPDNFFKEGK